MGADYAFYVKTIETHARTFLALNILAIGRVSRVSLNFYTFNISLVLNRCIIRSSFSQKNNLQYIPKYLSKYPPYLSKI